MTLLALSLTVPVVHGSTPAAQSGNLLNRLLADGPLFFGYAFAFVMIAVWWIIHNRTFQYIARYDSAVVWINMVLLIQIAFMPFVLSLFNDYSTTQVAVDLFAVIQITLGVTNLALWEYCRNHHLLKPNIPAGIARYYTYRGLLASGIFAVSIGVSFISVSFAEYVWIGTFIVQRFALRPGTRSSAGVPTGRGPARPRPSSRTRAAGRTFRESSPGPAFRIARRAAPRSRGRSGWVPPPA